MKYLFEYNWQIRNEWFDLLKPVSTKELYKIRNGGVQSIAYTFFHIIHVEYDWICDMQQKPVFERDFKDYENFEEIIQLSKDLHIEVARFVEDWNSGMERNILDIDLGNGNRIYCTYGEAMRHIIAHEIHHIGQLSIWAREIGIIPISANFIHRGIMIKNQKIK